LVKEINGSWEAKILFCPRDQEYIRLPKGWKMPFESSSLTYVGKQK
jgi:hypothetical protein